VVSDAFHILFIERQRSAEPYEILPNAQSPARDIQLMDALVSEIAIAVIPKTVPIVVKAHGFSQ
jgi:hypothetical protein